MSGIDGCDYEPYVKAAALKVVLEHMKANDEKFKEIKAQTQAGFSLQEQLMAQSEEGLKAQTQQEESLNKKKKR